MKYKSHKMLISCSLCFSILASTMPNAFADDSTIYSSDLYVELSPVTAASANGITSQSALLDDIKLHIDTGNSELIHESEIPVTVNVCWESKNWNTLLSGSAIVYNDSSQVVLLGQATGYNGEQVDENFISVNFTYDMDTGICIANATYDITQPENSQIEFGENSKIFENAYRFLETKMLTSAQQQVEDQRIDTIQPYAIDSSLRQVFSSGNNLAKMTMYAPKNLSSGGGTGPVSAKIYGSVSEASSYITKNVDSSAWAVTASNCDVSFSAATGLRYITGTHAPTNSQTNYEISIPLPLNQSYIFKFNVGCINAGVTSDETACHWNVFDVGGIDGIDNSTTPPGFKVSINQSGNKTGNIKVNGSSKIGYHYLYFDSTGNTNNTTWYKRTSGSGYVNIV